MAWYDGLADKSPWLLLGAVVVRSLAGMYKRRSVDSVTSDKNEQIALNARIEMMLDGYAVQIKELTRRISELEASKDADRRTIDSQREKIMEQSNEIKRLTDENREQERHISTLRLEVERLKLRDN